MICRIVKNGGRAELEIGGKKMPPLAYMTYNPKKENFDAFYEAGTRIMSFGVYATELGINSLSGIRPFRKSFFSGYGEYDFTDVFADLEAAASGHSDAYIILRVYLDCPRWWEEQNPEELARSFGGEAIRESFASEKWRSDMSEALFALIDAVEASPWSGSVIGYQAAAGGTEEWISHAGRFAGEYADYSEVNKTRYRNWLRDKYRDCAYPVADIPSPFERFFPRGAALRDPESERNVLDYLEYQSFIIADAIEYFCKKTKEKTRGEKLTGAFYGYLCEIADPEKGHTALQKLLESEYIDFFASPISYFGCRADGVDWPFMSAADSAALHGKLWFTEADVRTHLTSPMAEAMPHAFPGNGYYAFDGVWKGPPDAERSLANIKKCFAKVLCSRSGTWWFDMWGGWYDDPVYMDFYKKASDLYLRAMERGSPAPAQVAVVVDGESARYNVMSNPGASEAVYHARKALGAAGAPYEIYTLGDVCGDDFDAGRFKVVVFLNCVRIGSRGKEAINKKFKNNERTLVWTYFNGIYDENGKKYIDENNITGFSFCGKPPEKKQASYKGAAFPSAPAYAFDFAPETLDGAAVIAYDNTGCAAAALRREEGYTSVCSVLPNLPEALLRDIYVLSGVHVYNHEGAVVYAGGGFISVYTINDGYCRIYLPDRSDIFDAETGDPLGRNIRFYDFYSPKYRTYIFEIKQ